MKRVLITLAALLPCLAVSACSRKIGDGCTQNVECSVTGDRFCDLASPGGYCTVEGCDHASCPDGAACVRFFTLLRGDPVCDPARAPGAACRPGELCLCDDEGCARAYCASETSERRWCMVPCDDDGDCREGYRCYLTGQRGAVLVPRPGVPEPERGFCAPAPR